MSIKLLTGDTVYVQNGVVAANLQNSRARLQMGSNSAVHIYKSGVYDTTLSLQSAPSGSQSDAVVVAATHALTRTTVPTVVAGPSLVPARISDPSVEQKTAPLGNFKQQQVFQDEDDEMEMQDDLPRQNLFQDEDADIEVQDDPSPQQNLSVRRSAVLSAPNPGILSIAKNAFPYAKKMMVPVAASALLYTVYSFADWNQIKQASFLSPIALAFTETGQKAITKGAKGVHQICSGIGMATSKVFKAGAFLVRGAADALAWAAPRLGSTGRMVQYAGRDVQQNPVVYTTAAVATAALIYKN